MLKDNTVIETRLILLKRN